jgi:hypothetical protein
MSPAVDDACVSADERDDGREPEDDLRDLARELLAAEDAYRRAPTLDNTSRLARVRRRLEAVLAVGAQR